ncbi:MAG TPA: DUF4287 domain-containing protein [Thermoanaerobaculia bacterium]|nr:DUF4287 domain-containing protein [Thermoanaerobaculia bacterium]
MTQRKKLKKAIRTRSEKTGESYTSARRQILLARGKEEEAPKPPAPAAPAPPPSRARGGIKEESLLEKTGHGLDHWFAVLDTFGAATKGHTASAAHLYTEHGVPGWYAQGITVAYERARGLREVNQSCTGKFQVSVTKTVPASVAEVADVLRSADRRAAWLQDADPGLAQAVEAAFAGDKPREVKSKGDQAWLRFRWDGRTVEIRILGKPKGASVVATSEDLADSSQVEQRRAQWRAALDGLRRHLGG